MCGKAAISEEALGCHMRTVHRQDLELKKCNACDELFNTDKDKQTHVDKYHMTNHETLEERDLEITQRRKQNLHEIQIEDGEFINTEELLYSDDKYDPNNDTNNSESEDGSDTEGEQLLTEEGRLKCLNCDSTFRWKSGLDSHTQSKHIGQYKCFECRWSFKSEEKFKEHIAYLHSEYDTTTTESVDSESESEETKNNAEDTESEDEETKSNAEDTKSEIDENVSKSDTESFILFEKKSFCKICNKNFAKNSNLTRHIENMHSNNGQKRKLQNINNTQQKKALKI